MRRRQRRLFATALSLAALIGAAAVAWNAGDRVVSANEAAVEQRVGTWNCSNLQPKITKGGFTDPQYVGSNNEYLGDSPNDGFCVYWDLLDEAYHVFFINQRSLDALRETKAKMLPALEANGIDLCKVAFMSHQYTSAKNTNFNDNHDVGKTCAPEIYVHGDIAAARADEARNIIDAAMSKAAEIHGWYTTWPSRVWVYDDTIDHDEGIRADARWPKSATDKKSGSWTFFQSDDMTAITVNVSKLPSPELFSIVLSAQYHFMVQGGLIGSPYFLPEFASGGAALYFGTQVPGADSREAALLFQAAVEEAMAGKSDPLSKHAKSAKGGGSSDAYLRGYIAIRYLGNRWDPASWLNLMHGNVDGTPDKYLLQMSRLTTLTLDEFDRDMNEWLRQFGVVPTTTPRSGSRTATPERTPTPTRTPVSQ